ncbi:MAG: A/G-specific adenine glycosylase, partial [Bryobacteraceae bacterium]
QAVIPYFHRFLERFPTVVSLAAAPEPEVLAAWSGLGYYSRARNLQKAAQTIATAGSFPRDYDAIRALPGVGPYTAAAVSSIAFGLPHAVLDGNVMRVISRFTADGADIGAAATKSRFGEAASSLLDRRHPGMFNQAMMELGATLCLPRAPLCLLCPVAADCAGRAQGIQNSLPVKLRRVEPVQLREVVLVIERKGRILMRRRPATERLMPGFWELPSPQDLPQATAADSVAGTFKHSITFHNYTFEVVRASIVRAPSSFQWLTGEERETLPLTTVARKALTIL